MPRDKLLGDRFKIQKYKWYLVDLRDYHNPVLVRKHLDSKQQAEQFRDKYYENGFDVIYWKEAREYNLRDYINKKRSHKHHTSKYQYPRDCITPQQRHIFRNVQRKKAKQKMRRPKVTETAIWEILDDQPVLFVKRVKHYADNHWVYTEPIEGLKEFQKIYEWPNELRHLCNIVRTLNEYYDVGLYEMHKVALFIYKKWGVRIRRHCDKYPQSNPRDKNKIRAELLARGFQFKHEMEFFDEDNYIETIITLGKPLMAHPELCWHLASEKGLYDYYIYDFHASMGIPGWCRAHVAGIEKRR